jgi:hypothetical protein
MSCRVLHVTATSSAGSGLSVLSSTATVPACATAAEILASVFAAEKGGATSTDQRLMLFIQQEHFPLRPCSAAQVIKATPGMVAVAYPAAFMSETRDASNSVRRAPPPKRAAPGRGRGPSLGVRRDVTDDDTPTDDSGDGRLHARLSRREKRILSDDSDDESFGASKSKPTVQVPQKGRHPPRR